MSFILQEVEEARGFLPQCASEITPVVGKDLAAKYIADLGETAIFGTLVISDRPEVTREELEKELNPDGSDNFYFLGFDLI